MFSILKQTEDIAQRYAEAVVCGEDSQLLIATSKPACNSWHILTKNALQSGRLDIDCALSAMAVVYYPSSSIIMGSCYLHLDGGGLPLGGCETRFNTYTMNSSVNRRQELQKLRHLKSRTHEEIQIEIR